MRLAAKWVVTQCKFHNADGQWKSDGEGYARKRFVAWFEALLFVYLYVLRKTTTCLEEWPAFTVAIRSTVSFGKARIEGLTALWNIHDKHQRHRTYVRPSARCRTVSSSPEHSLVSPTETDGERLLWQALRLGAVYAQVQETPTLFSERSGKPQGTVNALAKLFAFALFHQYWNTSKGIRCLYLRKYLHLREMCLLSAVCLGVRSLCSRTNGQV